MIGKIVDFLSKIFSKKKNQKKKNNNDDDGQDIYPLY